MFASKLHFQTVNSETTAVSAQENSLVGFQNVDKHMIGYNPFSHRTGEFCFIFNINWEFWRCEDDEDWLSPQISLLKLLHKLFV